MTGSAAGRWALDGALAAAAADAAAANPLDLAELALRAVVTR